MTQMTPSTIRADLQTTRVSPRQRIARMLPLLSRHRALAAVPVLALFPLVVPFPAMAIKLLLAGLFAAGYHLARAPQSPD